MTPAERETYNNRYEHHMHVILHTVFRKAITSELLFADAYRAYMRWANAVEAITVMSPIEFSRQLTQNGHRVFAGKRNVRYVTGLRFAVETS